MELPDTVIRPVDLEYPYSDNCVALLTRCYQIATHLLDLSCPLDVNTNTLTDEVFLQVIKDHFKTIKYTKLERIINRSKFIKCKDGWAIEGYQDYDLSSNSGTCIELAVKTFFYLQSIFPDKRFIIFEDTQRPDGWNHFFLADLTDLLLNGYDLFEFKSFYSVVDTIRMLFPTTRHPTTDRLITSFQEYMECIDPIIIDPSNKFVCRLSETNHYTKYKQNYSISEQFWPNYLNKSDLYLDLSNKNNISIPLFKSEIDTQSTFGYTLVFYSNESQPHLRYFDNDNQYKIKQLTPELIGYLINSGMITQEEQVQLSVLCTKISNGDLITTVDQSIAEYRAMSGSET